ncbi:MAG: ribonuclease HII [Bacteroidales bacterium]|nr:ribonuclease HII [Bacteroidales bacterium]
MLKIRHTEKLIEGGCDEAGRGCLSGPVYAAAVILPDDFEHPLLNDSKKISEKNRYLLREFIIKNALDWAVGIVDNKEIDKINILNASIEAMHRALSQLKTKPEFILVDGNKFKQYKKIKHQTIVHGDGIYASIAAASILAKTFRDDYMIKLHEDFPQYNWIKNKGYATPMHKKSVLEYGLTDYHRKTFCSFYFQREIVFPKHN